MTHNLSPEDFYYDEDGEMVLTKQYHLKRGHCCKSGCKHCPFGFGADFDPTLPIELRSVEESVNQESLDQEILEKYADYLE